ncbi:AAA family ATPase, partial [Acinetobacter baumannii]|uniref:AAA family ATPase n=1 Tax=Acinetobacter baumannii TaxID=470 RepID=UPI001AEC9E20
FRTINNIYKKDTGDIFINQQSVNDNPILRESIFYLDERYKFIDNQTIKKVVCYYEKLYTKFDREKLSSLLTKYNLDENSKVYQLSKGNQALFNMILAFSCQCSIYLFDEPFDGLDLIIKKKVMSLLLHEVSFNQCSIVISSHNLQELESLIDHAII